jgi:hypothetical protein
MEQVNQREVAAVDGGAIAETRGFAVAGAVLMALAAFFVWRDLGVGGEYLLIGAATIAAVAEWLQRPRRWPHAGLAALLGCTLVGGVWFALGAFAGAYPTTQFHPELLLVAMAIAVVGCVAAAARTHLQHREGPLPAQVVFPIALIGLMLSIAAYYQFFTVGFAAEHVGRRLILTLTWLPVGLLLEAWGHARADRNVAHAGLLLVVCAVAKAVVYDTTHLDGGWRIAVLAVAGLLLLGGAWLLRVTQRVVRT